METTKELTPKEGCPLGTNDHTQHDKRLFELAQEIIDLETFKKTAEITPKRLALKVIDQEKTIQRMAKSIQDHNDKFHKKKMMAHDPKA